MWSIRTTATKGPRHQRFLLGYRPKAGLPHEVKHRSAQVLAFDKARQETMRGMDLVFGEERHRQASLRVARYQQALQRYHCHSIRSRTFEVGDLVLRRVLSREGLRKLSPMWEGLFWISRVSRPVPVSLETQDGIPIQNAWNIQHVRKFYP